MFKKILVPVDLSTESTTKRLCEVANDMAQKYEASVELTTVMPDYGMPIVASFFPADAQKKLKQETLEKLQNLAKTNFSVAVETRLVIGEKRSRAILYEIDQVAPDLVMIGCRRKKSFKSQRLLGSTSTAIANRAPCTVMVVR